MNYRIGFFFFFIIFSFSFLEIFVDADAIPDIFPDYNEFETEAATNDPEMFNGESVSLPSLPDDDVDSNPQLFLSSTQDGCGSSMSTDDTNLVSVGRKARVRPRAESCPNQGTPKPDPGLPNFGLFNPGSTLFDLVTPLETPANPPVQIFPQPAEQDPQKEYLERLFKLDPLDQRTYTTNDEDDPCPPNLVSDLDIPVCDSGNYAKDVLRVPGDYFFDVFNIRYRIYFLD